MYTTDIYCQYFSVSEIISRQILEKIAQMYKTVSKGFEKNGVWIQRKVYFLNSDTCIETQEHITKCVRLHGFFNQRNIIAI